MSGTPNNTSDLKAWVAWAKKQEGVTESVPHFIKAVEDLIAQAGQATAHKRMLADVSRDLRQEATENGMLRLRVGQLEKILGEAIARGNRATGSGEPGAFAFALGEVVGMLTRVLADKQWTRTKPPVEGNKHV